MPAPRSALDRFITTLHHRMVFARIVEGGGVGLAIGSGLALLSVAGRFAYRVEWLPATPWIVLFGVLVGAAAVWARRPGRLGAAIVADRQLELNDLLASALAIYDSDCDRDAAFAAAVLGMAENAAATHKSGQVRLARMGFRSWCGVALLLGLVITATVADSNSAGAGRSLAAAESGAARGNGSVADHPLLDLSVGSDATPIVRPDPSDLASSRQGQGDPPVAQKAADGQTLGESDKTTRGSPASPGTGGGAARTDSGQAPPTETATEPGSAKGSPSPAGAPTAGGAGRPVGSSEASDHATASGGAAGPDPISHAPPPWQSQEWPSQVQAARQAAQSGQVPAGYRDLIHAYFR